MKTLQIIQATVLASSTLLACQAFAADPAAPASPGTQAETRAEVKADLAKARADGTLDQKPNQDIQVAKPKAKKHHHKSKKAAEAAEAASAAK